MLAVVVVEGEEAREEEEERMKGRRDGEIPPRSIRFSLALRPVEGRLLTHSVYRGCITIYRRC